MLSDLNKTLSVKCQDTMKVLKPNSHVPSEWLWDYKEGERDIYVVDGADKSTVLFGIFIVDKFAKNCDSQLQSLLKQIESDLAIWNECFPWTEYNGIRLSLERLENGKQFIYGQLCAENDLCREEKIILGLLADLSKRLDPRIFIRICDTDGDFILGEIGESLPKEYEIPIGCNRLWLNSGQLKLIPMQNTASGDIRPLEALKFLEDSAFKLLDVNSISNCTTATISGCFPDDALSQLVKLKLVIENEKYRDVLVENPRLISFLLKSLTDEEVTVTSEASRSNVEPIELLVSKEHCNLIPFFFEANGLDKDPEQIPVLCGRAVSIVLDKLLRDRILMIEQAETSQVQSARLGSLFDLKKFSPASINLALSEKERTDFTSDLVENLQEIFSNEIRIDDDPESNQYDDNSSSDLDEECRRYFQNEGIDIDEDDFLEFFLKEGLKLSDNMINEVRAGSGR